MKKTFLFLLVSISFGVSAQNHVIYGFKIASNYNPDSDLPNMLGFSAGFVFNKEINKEFKIQAELFYMQYLSIREFSNVKQQYLDIPIINVDRKEYQVNKKAIQLPVVAQYYFNNSFYIEAGPQFGYIINGKLSYTKNDQTNIEGATITTEMKNQFDCGISSGLGYCITDNIGISARYYTGIIEKDNLFNLGIELKFK